MNKEEVKNTSEEMLLKITQYIDACDIPGKEKEELALEMACSLVTLTVDVDSKLTDIANDIAQKCSNISKISFEGVARYKVGIKDDVRYEF